MATYINNIFNFGRSLPSPFDTIANKKIKVSSKYGDGTTSTLCGTVIKAVHAVCHCMDGSGEGAVGIIDHRTAAEYKSSAGADAYHLVVYDSNTGSLMASVYDSNMETFENYTLNSSGRDGAAVMLALFPMLMQDDEFKENFEAYQDELKAGYSNLKPAYLVRYADDWILLTNSRENANRWKSRIANYLKVNLRLELSMEKTLVTNIKRKPIHFLGFTYKVTRGGTAMRGYKPVVKPQADRLNRKMEEVLKDISFLQRSMDKAESVDRINRINAKIRGLINYYSVANHVNLEMARYGLRVQQVALHALRRKGGTLVSANNVSNLLSLHENYKTMLAAIPIGEGQYIGVTSPAFCKYQKTYCKKPEETPYTVEGRAIHWERTRKKMTLPRMEEILTSSTLGMLIAYGKTKPIYNLEYFLNRMYALNRDKMRCRICGKPIVDGDDYHAHHIRKNLPLSEINRVSNLASTHRSCHKLVHGQKSKDGFSPKAVRQAEKYRKKLLS